uniref:Uncharacterized protein n=1 Tax=Sinocyclocheilus rhinocerous TaxID=307959 RepID=A0A673LSC5_9TELE
MSEVLPYDENISHYGDDGDEEQLSLTCRLQNNSSNFFSAAQNKRAPKLGQIGRSKRELSKRNKKYTSINYQYV